MLLGRWHLGLAVLLAVCGGGDGHETGIPTYKHWDAATGQTILCNRCPPGEYLKHHCTSIHPTECAPCPENHYTQYWNYINQCQYCKRFCSELQYVKHECNATHNRVCECSKGYYFYFDFCLKHSACPPGYGVEVEGTPHTNTVCKKCSKGFFSSQTSSIEYCKRHTDCESLGHKLSINGTSWHDNICFPLQNTNLKGITLYEEVLLQFLSRQNSSRHHRVLQLGRKLLGSKNAKHLFKQNSTLSPEMLVFLYVQEWKKKEKYKCLTAERLVDYLRTAGLKRIARKVGRKFIKNRYANIPEDGCNLSLVVD
ncbi:tumor necrosis factor receptor superfamily member 11B-like [Protopterus annectens]|uniref:tumor necrosis factor receptor superfamily member 11B-like n=1 Tax=Protopterus annectens TaxID=7888 RepID=UPI001CF98A63|nr:tumor necrosis factor receptor superfamily member 11B-like [Protopterus annectens]